MKYEYIVVHQSRIKATDYHRKTGISELGEEGWELICYWPEEYSFIFKRPLAEHTS